MRQYHSPAKRKVRLTKVEKMYRDLDQYLKEYCELPFERVVESYRRRAIVEALDTLSSKSLIEVGCGLRSIFYDLSDEYKGIIIEPIAELLERQKLGLNRSVDYRNAQFQDVMDLEIGSDRIVLFSSLLHELRNPEDLLEHSKRFLGDSGSIICVVPNGLSIHRFLGVEKNLLSGQLDRSETQQRMQQAQTVFTPETLTKLLEDCGFRVSHVRTFFPKLTSHARMQHLLDKGRITKEFLEQLFRLSDELEPIGSEILIIGEVK